MCAETDTENLDQGWGGGGKEHQGHLGALHRRGSFPPPGHGHAHGPSGPRVHPHLLEHDVIEGHHFFEIWRQSYIEIQVLHQHFRKALYICFVLFVRQLSAWQTCSATA